jgi:hypothetical protein
MIEDEVDRTGAMFSPLFRDLTSSKRGSTDTRETSPDFLHSSLLVLTIPRNVYPIPRRRQGINCSLAFERALPQSDEFTCAQPWVLARSAKSGNVF